MTHPADGATGRLTREAIARGLRSPASVAIVGDTPGPGRGGLIHERLLQVGFEGRILPVNPRYDEIRGLRAHPSLEAIDEPLGFVAIALGAARAVEVARTAVERGATGLLLISSGFAESGAEGRRLQDELRGLALEHAVPVVGPNCYGFVDVAGRFAAYFGALAAPLTPGPVSLVFQSGALTHALMDPFADRAPGYASIFTTGNEAVLDVTDYLELVLEDGVTRVVGCYLESVRSPERFVAAARRAVDRGVRLVVLKVGRTERARRAALAHTGALAGEERVWDTVLRDLGAVRVGDIDEMREAIALAAGLPRSLTGGAALLSISGGGSGIMADVAAAVGARLADFGPATRKRLAAVLPDFATVHDPLDVTGAVVEDPAIVTRAIEAVGADEATGLVCFGLNNAFAADPGERELYRTLARSALAARSGAPLVLFSLASGAQDPSIARLAADAAVPLLQGIRPTLAAIAGLQAAARAPTTAPAPQAGRPLPTVLRDRVAAAPAGPLGREVLAALLAEAGIAAPRALLATTPAAAARAADALGYPVVLKVASSDIAHRTDVGGVEVGLADAAAVEAAFARIAATVAKRRPDARIEGVEVHEQVSAGIEVLLGAIVEPGLPPVVVLGAGGTLVELQVAASAATAPLSAERARSLVESSALGRLLRGYRGAPAADVLALAEAVERLGALAWDLRDLVRELEVNPLAVLPAGRGVRALDILATRI